MTLQTLTDALARCARHGTLLLAVSIFVGLLIPPLAALARPILAPTVYLMLTLIMTRVDIAQALTHVRRPALALGFITTLLIVSPIAMAAVLFVLGDHVPHDIGLALIIFASAPSIVSSAAVSYLLGLDGALALVTLLGGIALSPFTIPLMTNALGFATPLTPADLGGRLALMIVAAVLSAWLCRRWLGPERIITYRSSLDGAAVLVVTLFAIAAMDGLLWRLLAEPAFVLTLFAVAFGVTFAFMAALVLGFRVLGYTTAWTLGLSGSMRNMALAIAALGTAVPADTWTYFAVAQFPIYLLPHGLKWWLARSRKR